MVCFFHRRARLLERRPNQLVTGPGAIDKCKHVIVGVALTYYLDTLLVFQTRQLGHHKRLFSGAHVTIIDIECETCGMWRSVDEHRVSIHPSQGALILLRTNER